ncbi:hypothetical protein [Desulfoluna butyratoxydans]|uniref:Uncharacterized protein n=1 Tax=Desulfoluna butyratoxydans TaxID=231438 RepID=A0A4U8YPE4_9BACT|nr:hypothetical protein [Desulfoluna butyratoxydans]VFQ43542.1 hypothetical protein MSL71_11770 [Desulfoluna butyratoxydans]
MNTTHHRLKSTAMAVTAWLLVLAGAGTLVPWAQATETNVIGYRSLCSFAPFSTLICLMGANILLTLRKRLTAASEE